MLRAAFLALLLAPIARAQMLPTGTWTGTLDVPRGASMPVAADVERCAEGLTVALTLGTSAPVEAQEVRLDGDRLAFRFADPTTRRPLSCSLARRPDGHLAGTCAADRRTRRTLTLRPPAHGAFGCQE